MILPPVLLSVMVALRMEIPNSISLMFPMMLPLAFLGPPDKERRYLKVLLSTAHVHNPKMSHLDRPECYTWTAERSLQDTGDLRC